MNVVVFWTLVGRTGDQAEKPKRGAIDCAGQTRCVKLEIGDAREAAGVGSIVVADDHARSAGQGQGTGEVVFVEVGIAKPPGLDVGIFSGSQNSG